MSKKERLRGRHRRVPSGFYEPTHQVTVNYEKGMDAITSDDIPHGIEILLREPEGSPCRVLALGNAAHASQRLGRFDEAERLARFALSEADAAGCPHAPSLVQFIRTLGEAIVSQGRAAESLPFFNSAASKATELSLIYQADAEELEVQKAHALASWGSAHLLLGSLDAAIDLFHSARELYRKHRQRNTIGVAETLTNFALACKEKGRHIDAELALQEALQVAAERGDVEQGCRVRVALIQLGSSMIPDSDVYDVLLQAATSAESMGLHNAAYVRHCIRASIAAERHDLDVGEDSVRNAERIEPHVDSHDPNRAKLRMIAASLSRRKGAPLTAVIAPLIEGAKLWVEQLKQPLTSDDILATNESMHEHFRMLAGALLQANRPTESLMSFEAGRALAHAQSINKRVLLRLRNSEAFDSSNHSVNTTLIRQVQEKLQVDDALIVISVLPPNLAAFTITRHAVDVRTVPIALDEAMAEAITRDIEALPVRLPERVGANAIPHMVTSLAAGLRDSLGSKVVRAILPYAFLHHVPWRAVLRHAGVPWSQLRCDTEFSLLQRLHPSRVSPSSRCVGLGHGHATSADGPIDLADEAKDFSEAFGSNGRFVPRCTKDDLSVALATQAVVFLSCHGVAKDRAANGPLVLELADGPCIASDAFGDRVTSPLVILSACDSGVYRMGLGDHPLGAAPQLVRLGARHCICARFPVDARFAKAFFRVLAPMLVRSIAVADAFGAAAERLELDGADLWRDLACLELVGRP